MIKTAKPQDASQGNSALLQSSSPSSSEQLLDISVERSPNRKEFLITLTPVKQPLKAEGSLEQDLRAPIDIVFVIDVNDHRLTPIGKICLVEHRLSRVI